MRETRFLCDSVKIGDRFGELTVVSENEEMYSAKGRRYYNCVCSCGNTTTVQVYQLLRGVTKSCGHLIKNRRGGHAIKDLSGKKFNNLTVICQDDRKIIESGKHAYWICKCDICGNHKSIRSSDLISGTAIDCGCQRSVRNSKRHTINLEGKVFGHMIVLGRDTSVGYSAGQHARWLCKCDLCGNIESVSSTMLTRYGKDRCKICGGISTGEKKIIEILKDNNISFVHDKPYLDCRYPDTGGTPRFDFRVNQNSDCDYMIEFDGEQHFKPIQMYDDNISLDSRIKRDNFKNDWCKERGIPIIRIPYHRLRRLNINDLKPDTSRYLVS